MKTSKPMSTYPTDSFDSLISSSRIVSEEIAELRLLQKRRHAECTKLIFLDLNGVLGHKIELDSPLASLSDFCGLSYRFKPRSGVVEFVKHLQEIGFYVVIYTSRRRPNTTQIVETMGLKDIVDGVLCHDHCVGGKKSITYALRYLRLEHRVRVEDCVIVDDTVEKIDDNPVECQIVVEPYDPSDEKDTAFNLMDCIVDRTIHMLTL